MTVQLNLLAHQKKSIVLYSGGLGSFCAAWLEMKRVGLEGCIFYFNDTLVEDADLYRFLVESVCWFHGQNVNRKLRKAVNTIPDLEQEDARKAHLLALGKELDRYCSQFHYDPDGRNIFEVFYDHRYMSNSRVDHCSERLKRFRSAKFVKNFDPSEWDVVVGMDWSEIHRIEKAIPHWLPFILRSPMAPVNDDDQDWQPRDLTEAFLLKLSNIAKPRMYAEGFSHNNCFAGETEFLTDNGIKTLESMVGQTTKVLGKTGGWENAEIQEFGEQQLYKLTVSRFGEVKVIYTTLDHGWFRRKGIRGKNFEQVKTSDLKPGDRLTTIFGIRMTSKIKPSAFGIAHGIVFGDGTRNDVDKAGYTNPARLMLCGEKDKELLKYFPLSPYQECSTGIEVRNLPRYFKDVPPLDESKSYLYGWLAGYIAADGSVDKDGQICLSSARIENLNFVKDVCCRLGIGTKAIKASSRLGLGKDFTDLYCMYLVKNTVTEDLFLITEHKNRFLASVQRDLTRMEKQRSTGEARQACTWKVDSVEETDRYKTVYCAVVPGTHSFTLEGNLLTSNCAGFCVKAGLAQFKLLYEKRPKVYAYFEHKQEELHAAIPSTRPFLRKSFKGEMRYLTLKQYREEFLEPAIAASFEDQYDFGGCACAL